MFGCRSFLMIGDTGAADIISLVKGGTEIVDFNFNFHQDVDDKGRATTKVQGGIIDITLSQLPPQQVVEWALNSKKYTDGVIVMLDAENVPLEKIFFHQATCTSFQLHYIQKGQSYATTKMTVQAEKLIVGNGIEFHNEWVNH